LRRMATTMSIVDLDLQSLRNGEKYYDVWSKGLYCCITCGSELYNSEDKFRARPKWPAFRKAANKEAVKFVDDLSYGLKRTAIKCSKCGQHVGHLFADGKTSGDSHPEAHHRHCVLSGTLVHHIDESAPIPVPPPIFEQSNPVVESIKEFTPTKPTTLSTEDFVPNKKGKDLRHDEKSAGWPLWLMAFIGGAVVVGLYILWNRKGVWKRFF